MQTNFEPNMEAMTEIAFMMKIAKASLKDLRISVGVEIQQLLSRLDDVAAATSCVSQTRNECYKCQVTGKRECQSNSALESNISSFSNLVVERLNTFFVRASEKLDEMLQHMSALATIIKQKPDITKDGSRMLQLLRTLEVGFLIFSGVQITHPLSPSHGDEQEWSIEKKDDFAVSTVAEASQLWTSLSLVGMQHEAAVENQMQTIRVVCSSLYTMLSDGALSVAAQQALPEATHASAPHATQVAALQVERDSLLPKVVADSLVSHLTSNRQC